MSIKLSVALLAVLFCQALGSGLTLFSRRCYVRRVSYATYTPRRSVLYSGQSVTYKCNSGYELDGPAVVKCGHFGFTTAFPKCIRIKGCRAPARSHFPTGMTYTPRQSFYKPNSKLWLSCADGYTLRTRYPSYESIRCSNGKWSPVRATCQRNIVCPAPEDPANGYIKGKGPFIPGTKVWVICRKGFVASGKKDFTCQGNGEWNGEFPTCDPIIKCDSLGDIENGSFEPESAKYNVGAEVTYECEDGFELFGGPVLTCQDDGTFDEQKPICIPLTCEAPTAPENGFVNPDDLDIYPVTTQIVFGCNGGFQLIGSSHIVCEEDGEWSDEFPTCEEIFCDAQPIDNGFFTPDSETFVVGQDVTYECDPGYVLDGEATIQCQADGEFDQDAPSCVRVQCAFPGDIDNGSPDSNDEFYNVDDTVTYECDEGYEIDGEAELTCQDDGDFAPGLPACVAIQCPQPPRIPNGYVRGDDFSVGKKVWVICNRGFEPEGQKDLLCLPNGQWNGEFATCVRPTCPAPVVPDQGSIKGARDEYVKGNKIWFFCNGGYILKGKKDLECLAGGRWSAPFPTCEKPAVKTCRKPIVSENGRLKGGRDFYVPGNKIWFFCNTGYVLKGKKDLACQRNGRWNAPFPTCEKAGCPDPVEPENGRIKGKRDNYVAGNKIWFFCDNGYQLKGKKDLACQRDGSWSAGFPTCEKQCGRPARVSYATYKPYKRSYDVNDKVEYKCRRGYFLIGEDDLKCRSNGKWAPIPPKCASTSSCRNRCNKYIRGAKCQCNSSCKRYGNCCSDFVKRCH